MSDKMDDPTTPLTSGAGTRTDTIGTASVGAATTTTPAAGTTPAPSPASGASPAATSPSSASAASGSQSATDMARETSDAARDRAQELGEQARSEAASMADRGKSMAYAKADEAMARGASEVETTADHIRAAGQEFGEGSYPAQAADYLASSLTDAADALRNQDVDTVIEEVQDFARRNPAVFIGGAALLGFLGARMLKASERARHQPSTDRSDDPRSFEAPPAGVAGTPYANGTVDATARREGGFS